MCPLAFSAFEAQRHTTAYNYYILYNVSITTSITNFELVWFFYDGDPRDGSRTHLLPIQVLQDWEGATVTLNVFHLTDFFKQVLVIPTTCLLYCVNSLTVHMTFYLFFNASNMIGHASFGLCP